MKFLEIKRKLLVRNPVAIRLPLELVVNRSICGKLSFVSLADCNQFRILRFRLERRDLHRSCRLSFVNTLNYDLITRLKLTHVPFFFFASLGKFIV